MADPFLYPFRTMRITQRYDGKTSHLPHTTGNPRDYPIDEGGADGERDGCYAVTDWIVRRVWGVGTKGVNTLWVESANRVRLADGTTDFVTMQLTHSNDADLQSLCEGQCIRKGRILCREGTDGASGNHLHLSVGRGFFSGGGWVKNSCGKWVLTTTGGALKPEAAFWLDPHFTQVLDDAGLPFRRLAKSRRCNRFRVAVPLLNVRTGPGLTYAAKPFAALSADAQKQIKALVGTACDGFVKGVVFTVQTVRDGWAKTPSGWVCLRYCEACL